MVIYYTAKEKLQLALDRGILVDDQDRWLLEEYTWRIHNGYAITHTMLGYDERGERVRVTSYLHHCIMGYPIWEGDEIDHTNRNKWDYRRVNLRYATKSQQGLNSRKVLGVSGSRHIQITPEGRYSVTIKREAVQYYLGVFDTLDEAAAERDEWLHNYEGGSVIDEVEFGRTYQAVRVLIGYATDPEIGPVNVRNALLGILALVDGLNQRITEIQEEGEDE